MILANVKFKVSWCKKITFLRLQTLFVVLVLVLNGTAKTKLAISSKNKSVCDLTDYKLKIVKKNQVSGTGSKEQRVSKRTK